MPDVRSPKGEDRIRSGHPWIYRSDRRRGRAPGAARSCWCMGRREASARPRALQRSVADRAAHADARGHEAADARVVAHRHRRRDRLSRSRSASTRRPTAWSTAKPTSCRRSSSIATATTSCVQALSQGDRSAAAGRSTRLLVERAAAGGHPGAQRPARAAARGARADASRCCTATCPKAIEVREGRGPVRRRSVPRPEDRAVPRSAREPRRRRRLRPRPAARCLQLQRRVRAGAGAGVRAR